MGEQWKDRAQMNLFGLTVALAAFATLGIGSCQPRVEDSSISALSAGQATMVLGGCRSPLKLGYEVCQMTKGQTLPPLVIGMLNPGEWAVSDCKGGFYRSGSVDKAGIVEIDLSGLQSQADSLGFCWLRLESTERYPSREDKNQLRSIAMAGGFIIELLEPGYMPVPAEDVTAWCYEIRRTTAGRTEVAACRSSTRLLP